MPLNPLRFARPLLGLQLVTLASVAVACDLDCDDKRAKALQQAYGVAFKCNGSECRARLTPSDVHDLWDALPKGGINDGCRDISALPDAHSSTAAMSDPCCHAGGSACTHFYHYVVSAAAAEMCVAL